MTRTRSGPTIDQGGSIAGNAPEKDAKQSPAGRGRGGTSAAEDQPPIDLDTARDRAS